MKISLLLDVSTKFYLLIFYFILLFYICKASHMQDMSFNVDEESSLDISSTRCLNSPSVSIKAIKNEF